MNFVVVILALLLQDGSQEFLTSAPESFVDGVDSDKICAQRAEEMARTSALARNSGPEAKQLAKFDFACVVSPNWSDEDPFPDQIHQLHLDNLKSAS